MDFYDKYFRANPATQDIPIIVLSTQEDPRARAETFVVGGNDYVVKMPDKLELIARIRYHSKAYIRLLERNEAYRRLEESKKILQAELAEAAEYVRSLLPKPLFYPIRAEWCFIPSMQLGGDAFGYHWLDEDHFAIYLLDVCGHGVGAALLSISVANLLRSQALPFIDFKDPGVVLKALNSTFPIEKHREMFFTIWYGVYHRRRRELVYATGGHPPALLLMGEAFARISMHELQTSGISIGLLPEAEFENRHCQVERYAQLYVFSDGVYEIRRLGGEVWRLRELSELIQQMARQREKKIETIVQVVSRDSGKKDFNDDFSLLQITFDEQ